LNQNRQILSWFKYFWAVLLHAWLVASGIIFFIIALKRFGS